MVNGGPIVKTMGDGVLIEFGSVVGGENQDIFSSGPRTAPLRSIVASGTDAVAPIKGIYTMTLRDEKGNPS
jgi:class 3 adenylate cyclase